MTKKEITIRLSSGLEARPVAMLVQVASQFESEIHVISGERNVNAKSIMGMMTLGLSAGEKIVVTANGADERNSEYRKVFKRGKVKVLLIKIKKAFLRGIPTAKCFFSLIW